MAFNILKLALVALVLGIVSADLQVSFSKSGQDVPEAKIIPGWLNSYNEGSVRFPNDNGGNFGDLIHRRRENGDRLIHTEMVINDDIFNYEADLNLQGNFPNTITQVRAVNVGRQRAYINTISTNGNGDVQIKGKINKNQQVRVIVEIYGR